MSNLSILFILRGMPHTNGVNEGLFKLLFLRADGLVGALVVEGDPQVLHQGVKHVQH